ncbi:metal ABC transporter substrate-binding protein [Nocardioides alkalitolerans]|uniref:metal ABC transporter substrate-binding protein n=1 Tax=Nocardioides alkalitolerans TaxID=281714 RepID=UPI0005BD331F|nr:metal ABC transporter substrate-binding protein [Nocardioides alkalitolerans]
MPSSVRRTAPRRSSARVPALAVAATVALTGALSGCGALGLGDDAGASGGDGQLDDVVAAFYPLQYAAQRVAGDEVEVSNLVSPGGEPHDLELSVEQTGRVADADLVIYLADFQPSVDGAVEQSAGDAALDVGPSVDLRANDETEEEHAEHSEEGHSEEGHSEDEHAGETAEEHAEHADEEDHAHEEGEEHDHDHGEFDPHFWLDPLRLADAGDAIAERLGELDPDAAETFEANAADLRTDLEALDTEFADGLASCERDLVVVNHDAFGYLTKYGLEFASIVGLTPDAEPTPAALAELQTVIADEGITTVFAERLASPQAAESLANDTGLAAEVLDPIEGLTDQTADEDYLSLMRANLATLSAANGC